MWNIKHRSDLGPWILYVGIIWLTIEYFILWKFSYFPNRDSSEIYLALAVPGVFSLKWIPQIWCGIDPNTLGFDSVVVRGLFAIIPTWYAYLIMLLSIIGGGTWAMYELIRRRMPESGLVAALVALAFGSTLDGFMVFANRGLFPLALLGLTAFLDSPRSIPRFLAAVAAAIWLVSLPFASNVFQFYPLALVSWFAVVDPRRDRRQWAVILAFAAIPAVRLPEVFALTRHLGDYHFYYFRGPTEILPLDFLSVFDDPAYGLLTLFAAIGAATTTPRRRWSLLAAVGGVILLRVAASLSTEQSGTIMAVIHGFKARKLWDWSLPAVAMAAAFGLRYVLTRIPPRRGALLWRSVLVILILSTAWTKAEVLSRDWLSNGSYTRNMESPVLRDLAKTVAAEPWPVRVEPIFAYAAHLNTYGFETATGDVPVVSRSIYEFWSTLSEPWIIRDGGPRAIWNSEIVKTLLDRDQNWPMLRAARPALAVEGSDTIRNHAVRDMDATYRMNLLSLANIRYIVSREPLSGAGLVQLAAAPKPWGELSVLEKAKVLLTENFTGRTWLYVYRNDNALPRFFTVTGLQSVPSSRALLDAMAKASTAELRRTAYVDSRRLPAGFDVERRFVPGDIRLLAYRGDRIELEVAGDGPMFLVVTNRYTPYWTVAIDGNPTNLLEVDRAFQGVELPAGRHRVTLVYRPDYLPWEAKAPHAAAAGGPS